MEDVGDDPILPPPLEQDDGPLPIAIQATPSGPPPEDNEGREDIRDDRDIVIEDEGIVRGTEDATRITLAEDPLLDDQVVTGAKTPSGTVAELLSQMNMGSPATLQVASDLPDESQVT